MNPVGNSVNDLEQLTGAEGVSDYYLKVQLASARVAPLPTRPTPSRPPRLRAPRSTAQSTEDDGTAATAAPLTLVPDIDGNPGVVLTDLLRCNAQDADLFRFSMPPNLGGVVRLRFTHADGNMALDLLDADGDQIGPSSDVSTTNSEIDEQLSIPGSATETVEYIARARLSTPTGGTLAQLYTLEVQTFDNAQCVASEPSGGDDERRDGRCVGTFDNAAVPCVNGSVAEPLNPGTLATCAGAVEGSIVGCGRICDNNDDDWYRVGTLNNDQIFRAVLDYEIADGPLALVRGALAVNGIGTVAEVTTTDGDNGAGALEFSFPAPRNTTRSTACA